MVEDPTFLDLMGFCVPMWKILTRGYFARWAIPALADSITEALRAKLEHCFGRLVYLTTDIWTSRQVQDYMSVAAHWSVPNEKGSMVRHKAVLDMSALGKVTLSKTLPAS